MQRSKLPHWGRVALPPFLLILCSLALIIGLLPLLHLVAPGHEQEYLVVVALLFIGLGLACFSAARLYCRYALGSRYLKQPLCGIEHWLYTTAFRLALKKGLQPPLIAVYPSSDFNAFAIGPFRQHAVIVLSEGLIHGLKPEELEAVLAHEISHIANGDVQTLSLLQAVISLVIELPARLFDKAASILWPDYRQGGNVYLVCFVLLQLAGGWLASLLVMRYSRHCEYRADRQAAMLVGMERMVSALRRLDDMTTSTANQQLPAFGLSGRLRIRCMQLFNSHPSLHDRLQVLRSTL